MKRLLGLILAVLLLCAGCGTKGGRDMPRLEDDYIYTLGTYSFTMPAGWYTPELTEDDDSTTLYFYPPEGDGMISLASFPHIDLMDTWSVASFLNGYEASREGLEAIDMGGVSVGTSYGLWYEYYDIYSDVQWHNVLYLMDAGSSHTAAILVTYPKDASAETIAQFSDVIAASGLTIDDESLAAAVDADSAPDHPVLNQELSEHVTSEMKSNFSTTSWYRRIVTIEVYDDSDGSRHLEIMATPLVSEENQAAVVRIIDALRAQDRVDGVSLIDDLESLGVPAYTFLSEAGGMAVDEVKGALETGGVPGSECAQALEDYIAAYETDGLERIAYTIETNYLDGCTYAEFRYDTDDIVLRIDF